MSLSFFLILTLTGAVYQTHRIQLPITLERRVANGYYEVTMASVGSSQGCLVFDAKTSAQARQNALSFIGNGIELECPDHDSHIADESCFKLYSVRSGKNWKALLIPKICKTKLKTALLCVADSSMIKTSQQPEKSARKRTSKTLSSSAGQVRGDTPEFNDLFARKAVKQKKVSLHEQGHAEPSIEEHDNQDVAESMKCPKDVRNERQRTSVKTRYREGCSSLANGKVTENDLVRAGKHHSKVLNVMLDEKVAQTVQLDCESLKRILNKKWKKKQQIIEPIATQIGGITKISFLHTESTKKDLSFSFIRVRGKPHFFLSAIMQTVSLVLNIEPKELSRKVRIIMETYWRCSTTVNVENISRDLLLKAKAANRFFAYKGFHMSQVLIPEELFQGFLVLALNKLYNPEISTMASESNEELTEDDDTLDEGTIDDDTL